MPCAPPLLPLSLQADASHCSVVNWDKDKLRAAVVVEHNARPCLKYVAERLLSAVRGDRVYLARPRALDAASAQAHMTSRRLMESFTDLAASVRPCMHAYAGMHAC